MGPSPVVFIVVVLSTISYATLQTVPTTSVSTSKRIVTSASRVSTSTDSITTITAQLFTATTRLMESMTGTTGLGVTTSQKNIERTTHGTTHNNARTHETIHNNATTPNNQTVSQKLVSTAVPLTVSVDNGETLLGQVGSDAIITCSVSGSGAIKVVWIGPLGNTLTNNTKYSVTSYNINIGKSTLAIFALSMTDIGLYTCRAMDGFGSTAEDSITLTVYGTTGLGVTTSQQNIERTTHGTTHNNATTPNNQTVSQRLVSTAVPLTVSVDNGETLLGQVGSDAIITCSVSGSGAIKVVWIGPLGNTLTNNTKYSVTSYNINIGKSTLAIFALSMTDIGLYTCRAMDGFGSTAEDSITLTVYGSTGLGVTTSQQNIERTTHGTTHNNATTPNNQTVSQRLVSTAVPLTVSVDNGETLLGQVGSDAIITCSVSGSGAIKVVWIGPLGNTLTNNTKYSVTSYNINIGKSTLAIFALSMTDIGLYTCRAMDGFGSTAEDSITLTVHESTGSGMSPEMTTSKQNMITITTATATSTLNIAPTTPNNQTVIQRLESTTVPLTVSIDDGETMFRQIGSDATITCSASGVGNINVVWIGPAWNTLTNNAKYNVTSYNINTGKSTLTIFALSTTDSGSYICLATDGFRSTAYDSITLTVHAEITGAGMTPIMRTSKQAIITTTPEASTATHNMIPAMPSNQTVIQRLVSTTTPEASATTHSMVPTMPSNQTVIQRLVSTTTPEGTTSTQNVISTMPSTQTLIQRLVLTTTPEASAAKQSMVPTMPSNQTTIQSLVSTTVPLTVSVDNGETMLRQVGSDATITCSVSGSGAINVIWIGPALNTLANNTKYTVTPYNINIRKSTLTIFALSTSDNGLYTCRATDGFGSTAEDSITLTVHGQTPPEVTSLPHNVTMPSPVMLNSSQDMPSSTLTKTPTSLRGLAATTGITSPAMAATPQNIAAAEQISTTSMNSTTPLPLGTTKRETRSTTGIPAQSNNCCFNENMVIMLRDNVPLVNGFIPFVSILEQTNGTDIAVCDAKVLLKATFRRSNQTAPCQGCTSVPQCGNQMLKIDLWMSPIKNGFSFHAGDSITNDGYGGDNNTQENDAEFHIYNYEQRLYGSDKCLNMSQLIFSLPNNSAHWVTIHIGNEFIRVSTPLGDAYELCSDCLFALNGQSDSQGTVNEDVYIGLNRIIRSSNLGDGNGVCGAVISWACPWKT